MNDIISPNGDIGTGGFHAPEILNQQAYNFKSDVFMLGVTFCLLVSYSRHQTMSYNIELYILTCNSILLSWFLICVYYLKVQAPKMLKSNGADRLLRYMHEVKVCKRLGRSLYEATVERELMQWNYNMVPPKVKDIIWSVIEYK